MKLGVDLDGVVVDACGGFLEWMNRDNPDGKQLTLADVKSWDRLTDGRDLKSLFDAFFSTPMAVAFLRPIPGAVEMIRHLSYTGHEIRFITARRLNTEAETRLWLQTHGLDRFEVTFTHRRGNGHKLGQGVDVLIDDRIQHVQEAASEGSYAILFDWPWNRGKKIEDRHRNLVFRARNWEQIRSILLLLGDLGDFRSE